MNFDSSVAKKNPALFKLNDSLALLVLVKHKLLPMKQILLLLTMAFCITTFAQNKSGISIIPEPVNMQAGTGAYSLPSEIRIAAGTPELNSLAEYLKLRISPAMGRQVQIAGTDKDAAVRLTLNTNVDQTIGTEGYRLSVKENGISISANRTAGLFYGIQSLLQLFPPEIESKEPVKGMDWKIPLVEITDYPRFGWRGLMFDVSRHFFTKEEVKDFIDDMVRYKYNLLHWHLTDDEGWRIEIKSYPKLTEVGAWNVKKVGAFGTFTPPKPNEPRDYGGFYTQEDIKEVIKYAQDRFVNILPEIDVPGHSLAAIASYPELSCTPGADKYVVRSGEKIMEWHGNGKFTALVDNTLCPANEKVYEFLDKVVEEVAQLFPFEYIHMGGDESATNFWDKSPQVKALMKREGMKSVHEVQGYFENRVQKIVTSKGKKFIGWDEILEGKLSPDAAIMSWRGIKGGVEAAKKGHQVVMSPSTFAYLDYMQADPVIEPRVYASLLLNKTYQFEPVPEGVDPKFIKGGQGNLWTEQIYNMRHVQYMLWPRAFAVAESVWSPKEKKSWEKFIPKVEEHFKRFEMAEMNYSIAMYDPIFKIGRTADRKLKIELSTQIEDLDIYYSFDNSFPDRFYPKYEKALVPPTDATTLKLITYKGKNAVGRMHTVPLSELAKRAK